MDCINCMEHRCVEIINGIGICKDPECIFIHNTINPTICAVCKRTYHHTLYTNTVSPLPHVIVYGFNLFKSYKDGKWVTYQELGIY